jgi:hypothetical protein
MLVSTVRSAPEAPSRPVAAVAPEVPVVPRARDYPPEDWRQPEPTRPVGLRPPSLAVRL